MEWQLIGSSLVATFFAAGAGFLVSWGANKEFKADTKRRLDMAEAAIKKLEEDVSDHREKTEGILKTVRKIEEQNNRIENKLNDTMKEILDLYKDKAKEKE